MGLDMTWSLDEARRELPTGARCLSCPQGPVWDVQDVLLALSEPLLRTRGLLGAQRKGTASGEENEEMPLALY